MEQTAAGHSDVRVSLGRYTHVVPGAERGAERIVVVPFFLGPGKHWTSDIPRLTADASRNFPQTRYHISPTLGVDDLILDLLAKRACHCEEHAYICELCRGTLRSGVLDAQ